MRNNIATGSGQTIVNFTGGGDDDANSWTLPVDVSSDDFVSMDKAIGTMPRNGAGSLPSMLMRLVQGSDLIDRGEDVGLPFVGSAAWHGWDVREARQRGIERTPARCDGRRRRERQRR
jgi:hypothetical protein